ncbi:MAG: GntR family transcriptional regulator [Clostridiales bacterium]|nr:GntR family transcriptional regulator [Clostridiales bacterium]MDR2750992.1 GntR family transcriptional regulator [Clostridiales bacterium]
MFDSQRNAGETTKEYLYRALKEMILRLEVLPGASLTEGEIVKELDISRTPVREVLKRLEAERLLDIIPQSGTKVSLIDKNLVDQVLFMRCAVEKEVVMSLQSTLSPDILMDLDNVVSTQEFYISKGMIDQFQLSDNEFHEKLFACAKKEIIWENISSLSSNYYRMRLLMLTKGHRSDPSLIVKEHQDILNCIRSRLPYETVAKVMTSHIIKPAEVWQSLCEDPELRGLIRM